MRHNSMNRFQALYSPDPDGLSARLAAFVDGPKEEAKPVEEVKPDSTPKAKPVASTQEVKPDADPAKPDPAPAAKPVVAKPDDAPEEEEEDDDVEFPEIGKTTTKEEPKELDEDAFDAETAKAAEGMDEKASVKFKKLRDELKVFKKREFKPDPEAIPEFKALKAEAEELRKKAEEAEGLRARLDAVMKTSDELAVKESPEFISKVKEPLREMKGAIAVLAEASGIAPVDLLNIIAEEDPAKQDKALTALESKLPRRTLSRIERFCDDYKIIEQEESRLLSDIPKSLAETRKQQAEQAEKSKKLATSQFQGAARKSFESYAHTIPGFSDESGQLSETAKAAQNDAIAIDPHTLEPDDLGFMMFASKALPAATKEIKRLRKELRLLKGGEASPIPGTPPKPKKAQADEAPKGQTLAERMKGQSFTFNPSMVG